MIRIAIADDHAIVRTGLFKVFSAVPGLTVIGEADAYPSLVELLRREVPDVLLLDVSMPGISGIDCIHRLRASHPELRILNLTMHHDAQLASRLLEAGANGYVTKSASMESLISAIRAVSEGKLFIDPSMVDEIQSLQPRSKGGGLSNREFDILRQLKTGKSLVEIAADLHISPKTVATHKARIMSKLGLTTNAKLYSYVIADASGSMA